MTFTIEQLEDLKEGMDNTPWRYEYDEWEDHWVIAFDHPKFGGRWDKGIAHGEGVAKLFAAAPELVDALIAEKQAHAKLLRKLDEMLSWWGKSSEKLSARGMEELAEVSRRRMSQLAQILEGHNE